MKDSRGSISRRSFMARTAAAVAAAGIGISAAPRALRAALGGQDAAKSGGPAAQAASSTEGKPHIKEYRPLGKTGWKVSDISFGNAMMQEPSLLEYAIERGINYVDTARQYFEMEVVVGKLFPAKRDKLWVTTKLLPELFRPKTTVEQVTTAIDESVKRLNTDCVDCIQIHSVGEDPVASDPMKIRNENIYTAFENARKAGKIKTWGASSHGPRMIEDFTWLIDNTPIDLIQPGMNFMTKGLEPVLNKARAKGVAVVSMKSLATARKIDYKPFMGEGRTVRQAILKWMLAHDTINSVCLTMRNVDQVDEYVAASGRPEMTPEEKKALEGYGTLLDHDYCRPGCSGCLAACPAGVPIAEILRYRLYFDTYGEEKRAIALYRKLPASRNAARCASCLAPCEAACPYNLAIRSKLVRAHDELTV
jgi:predicted aldo/keto reductase-like oxidoreductase